MVMILKTIADPLPEGAANRKNAMHDAAMGLLASALHRADPLSFPGTSADCLPPVTRLEHGKPVFDPENGYMFSLSHSGRAAVCALSDSGPIGIDVQDTGVNTDVIRISSRFFSPAEQNFLSSLPQDLQRIMFFRIFSCKEAYVKMTGRGLSEDFGTFSISPSLDTVTKDGEVTGFLHVFEEFSGPSVRGALQVPYTLAVCTAAEHQSLKNSLISV